MNIAIDATTMHLYKLYLHVMACVREGQRNMTTKFILNRPTFRVSQWTSTTWKI